MLEEFAFALNLEDIETISEALFTYGADLGLASKSVKLALMNFLKDLDRHLDEIRSVDDLDSFEHDLKRLMDSSTLHASSVPRDIACRRQQLYELEDRDDDHEGYSRQPSKQVEREISTQEIRSMFKNFARL